ncbi:hypothetical protein BRC97_07670 [Halobacteriales archaeon QS_6_71_20]|nr:MAG: hypothetical protein BRC97_07670 [Halobacteriales archaeon QS_6_71_20]
MGVGESTAAGGGVASASPTRSGTAARSSPAVWRETLYAPADSASPGAPETVALATTPSVATSASAAPRPAAAVSKRTVACASLAGDSSAVYRKPSGPVTTRTAP